MTSRNFAQILAVLFTLVGLLGFFPGLKSAPPLASPELVLDTGYGWLFGLFPVNWLHNLVHLTIGIAAWYSSGTVAGARQFARGLTFFYGALAVMGLFPFLNSTFGFIPLYGHDIWLHAGTAAAAAYFGFGEVERTVEAGQYRRAA